MKLLKKLILFSALLLTLDACQSQQSDWMYGRWEADMATTERANQELQSAFAASQVDWIFKNLKGTPPLELNSREVIIGDENPSHFTYQTLQATEEAFQAQMPGNVLFVLRKDQNGVYRENTGFVTVDGERKTYTVKLYLKSSAIQAVPQPVH